MKVKTDIPQLTPTEIILVLSSLDFLSYLGLSNILGDITVKMVPWQSHVLEYGILGSHPRSRLSLLNEQESQRRLPSAATSQLRSITDAVLKRVLLSSPHFSWDVEHQGVSLNWINNVEKMG